MIQNIVMTYLVQLTCRNPLCDMVCDHVQYFSSKCACLAHCFKPGGIMKDDFFLSHSALITRHFICATRKTKKFRLDGLSSVPKSETDGQVMVC